MNLPHATPLFIRMGRKAIRDIGSLSGLHSPRPNAIGLLNNNVKGEIFINIGTDEHKYKTHLPLATGLGTIEIDRGEEGGCLQL